MLNRDKKQFIDTIMGGIHKDCIINDYVAAAAAGMTATMLSYLYDELVDKAQVDKAQVKVMRSDAAKEFPLIRPAKCGDVGMDLPAVFLKKPFSDQLLEQYISELGDGNPCEAPKLTQYEMDKITHHSITILPNQRAVIPTGIHLELPAEYWASIEARSSTSKQLLVVPKGVIDEGYRGELFAVLINVGDKPVTIYHGDRYVQLIIHKRHIMDVDMVEVDELSPSERGSDGFGSTGRSAK